MTEFYRFRTVNKLLEEPFKELESQTIFFAPPEELNDPMEGLCDLVWDGDHIVWLNLFKHYVHCLTRTCLDLLIIGQDNIFGPGDIPVEQRQDSYPTPRLEQLFKDVWQEVQGKCELEALAENIAKLEYSGLQHRVKRAELLYYLVLTHMHLLAAVQDVFVGYNFITEAQRIPTRSSRATSLTINGYFELLKQISEINASTAEIWFSVAESVYRSHLLSHRFVFQEIERKNAMFLLAGYPSAYLEQLSKMLWPNWYTACFVKEYRNSSIWANYADGHKGACLIFEGTEADDKGSLELRQITGWSSSNGDYDKEHWGFAPISFHKVDYKDKPDEVDFFSSMGQISQEALINLWYTSNSGDLSYCANKVIGPSADVDIWRAEYWDNFYSNACFKSKDWEYEKEFRLILNGGFTRSLNSRQRTLSYDFISLKGIIFGMRMSDNDKWEIFATLTKKCRESHRTDFQFLQAYYSPETGDIRSYEIPVNLSDDISQEGTEEPPG